MNQDQIDGMQARSNGEKRVCSLPESRKEQWLKGYDIMDTQICNLLKSANEMLEGIRALRKPPLMRITA